MVHDPPLETVVTWSAPPIVFGAGALGDLGYLAASRGLRRIAVVTDPGVRASGSPDRAMALLIDAGLEATCFDAVHVEPTDASIAEAVDWARGRPLDGFVAVGGGSAIDTAKAMNLLSTNDGSLEEYLNPPIGAGRRPDRPLRPLIAVPTTAGTGSESTPVCILDVLHLKLKTGISHPALRPTLAVIDPELTLSLPAAVTAASGMDILCHALESYTARPFHAKPAAAADARPAYNGANPISDLWALQALDLLGRWFRRAVDEPGNREAREGMMLAATFAGIGFGNAGVHIPHACGYPVAGMVRAYRPAGYDVAEPMVPHGQSVVATAPAAFRFTHASAPERHAAAARALSGDRHLDAGPDALPTAIVELSRATGVPNGIAAFGYGEGDIDALVAGALKQQRLLAISPLPVTADDLAAIFRGSMENW